MYYNQGSNPYGTTSSPVGLTDPISIKKLEGKEVAEAAGNIFFTTNVQIIKLSFYSTITNAILNADLMQT